MLIKLFTLCASLSWLITHHADFKKIHVWLFDRAYQLTINDASYQDHWKERDGFIPSVYAFIYKWISCSYCTGFWTAFFVSMVLKLSIVDLFVNGFISAIISLMVCTIYERISR